MYVVSTLMKFFLLLFFTAIFLSYLATYWLKLQQEKPLPYTYTTLKPILFTITWTIIGETCMFDKDQLMCKDVQMLGLSEMNDDSRVISSRFIRGRP